MKNRLTLVWKATSRQRSLCPETEVSFSCLTAVVGTLWSDMEVDIVNFTDKNISKPGLAWVTIFSPLLLQKVLKLTRFPVSTEATCLSQC